MITKENIPMGDQHLSASIRQVDDPKAVIILLTGSGGVKDRFHTIQETLAEHKYASISFDFRGRGESSLKDLQNSLEDEYQDAIRVVGYARQSWGAEAPLVLLGTSMGAFVAAVIASQLHADYLILSSPALYMPEHEGIPQKQTKGKAADIIKQSQGRHLKATSLKRISEYTGKLLVLEHELDDVVPHWLCKEYFQQAQRAAEKEYKVLKDVEHPVLVREEWKKKLTNTTLEWLSKYE